MQPTYASQQNTVISIVIATFNAAADLADCLDSIARQPLRGIEVIVVDGGSTDGTLDILRASGLAHLRWISENDHGIFDAMNKGVDMATGRWIYFMGADDRLLPGFSELGIRLKDPQALYYGDSEPHYEGEGPRLDLPKGRFSPYRLAKHGINQQALIYPAAVFRKYRFDLRYTAQADIVLNFKVWGDAAFPRHHWPISIVRYNMQGFSSRVVDETFRRERPALIRRYLGWWVYARLRLKHYKRILQREPDFWAPLPEHTHT
ncbi:glycosyltransferase family 2 protein [Chitinophaga lutea]